ncbi:hypothetical protein [Cecembia lonarensis]|uniref:Phytase-like domain-containing protein n=1 Tax=Cecembia lonarensis (strain CCUG 58316 / KCTC 22772 / LW9) TaxID=1225176 RepID=K1LKT8_CECL9|nr:hypothetical protein [Cecembia lonarensis]EKB51008.1 hypothetical protein B879_00295 [Cecembia lonarensis LW9]
MKKCSKIGLYALLSMLWACGRQESNQNQRLTEGAFELEIIDSLVVDYIGLLSWSHISPNGQKFLAMDHQRSEIILIDHEGQVIQTLQKTGDQPESIGPNLMGRPQFRNNEEIALLGVKGLSIFDFSGNLREQFKPDFNPAMNFIILNADVFQFKNPEYAVALLGGRNSEGSGFYESVEGTKLEAIDLNSGTYSAIIPFSENSRFNTSEIFPVTNTIPVLRTTKEGLYIGFKNESKLFYYTWEDLNTPSKEIQLQIDNFQLMKGKDLKSVDRDVISFDTREFAYGAINHLYWVNGQLLVGYSKGLSDEEYQLATEGIDDFQEMFNAVGRKNKAEWALVAEDGSLNPVEIPDNLGRIEFVDQEGNLWISPNRNDTERDYEVLFKARLR